MGIRFEEASLPPIESLTAEIPSGAMVGLTGEDGAAIEAVLIMAGGFQPPAAGAVQTAPPARWIGCSDALNLAPAGTLVLHHALARHDAVARARALIGLERLRREGACILMASHETDLLRAICDEVWWLDGGRLAMRGDPGEVLEAYGKHTARRLVELGASVAEPLAPRFRRGDGRASLVAIETLDAQGRPAAVWQSGDEVAVRVSVRFEREVADPVVGILIRTRIGLEVYGTNTELERIHFGPCQAGEVVNVTFSFRCHLCPQQYTLTAASHDPDGVWHDWMEDAVAFSVADSRYTAGVANLRAAVRVERGGREPGA